MIRTRTALVVAGLSLAVAATVYAGDKSKDESANQRDQAIANLLIGLKSDNAGLRESCASVLGQLHASEAVIPLMDMLHTSDTESERVVAALALCQIGDDRGTYAVKGAARFDGDETVRQRCAWFYNEYVQPGSFEFVVRQTPQSTDYAHHR